MKRSSFKKQYSPLKRKTPLRAKTGFNKSTKRMRSFREVKGEDENVLQVREADRQFSLEIRRRDKQCVSCGSGLFLGCSHYFGRVIYATRYDPLNCITLCSECHEKWELQKKGIYKDFMMMWLGEGGFLALELRSKERISPYEAIFRYMKLSNSVEETQDVINY